MDDNCGEWVESMGVASGWNLWVWLVSVVVRRYIIDILIIILLSPTPLVLALFLAASSLFLCSFLNVFPFLFMLFCAMLQLRIVKDYKH